MLGGSHGAALNAQSKDGWTPLHRAASNGKTAAVGSLLELGADASLRNKKGKIALELAVEKGFHDIAQLLRAPELLALGQARSSGLSDAALKAGTRLHIDPHGDGTYLRWEQQRVGPNAHIINFDGEQATEQLVQLRSLGPAAWSVLLPPPVEAWCTSMC